MVNTAVPEVEVVVETALYGEDLEQIERFYTEALGLSVNHPSRSCCFPVTSRRFKATSTSTSGWRSCVCRNWPQQTRSGGCLGPSRSVASRRCSSG
jgi:hypothetical protein